MLLNKIITTRNIYINNFNKYFQNTYIKSIYIKISKYKKIILRTNKLKKIFINL